MDEETPGIGEEDEDAVIEDEEEGESQEPQTDERGVPLKNVYAEVSRKIKAMEKRYEEAQRRLEAAKDGEIRALRSRIQEIESTKPKGNDPEYTRDELVSAYIEAQNRGDKDLQREIMTRILDLQEKTQEAKVRRVSEMSSKEAEYNNMMYALFPQLRDQTSQFFAEVAREIDSRTARGVFTGPSRFLDAANAVAVVRPDLIGGGNRVPSANPNRRGGFSESGSGRPVTKSKPDSVQIDESLFNKWAKDYPGLDRKSVEKRMREIKERSNWNMGEAI